MKSFGTTRLIAVIIERRIRIPHACAIVFPRRHGARFCQPAVQEESLNRMARCRGKCVSRLKRVSFSFIIKALLVTLRTRGARCIFMSYIDMHLAGHAAFTVRA